MFWTPKDLQGGGLNLVRFRDGGLYSILRDRTKKNPTYTLGDELGMIEGNPKHQGPLSEHLLLIMLNDAGATPISLGDAQQVRADYRVKVKQANSA